MCRGVSILAAHGVFSVAIAGAAFSYKSHLLNLEMMLLN